MKNRLHHYTKNRRKVYIIPSQNGIRFIIINFFMFLIAMAYANNMALLITFSMFSYLLFQMFSTHRYIQDLQFKSLVIDNTFCDEKNIFSTSFKENIPEAYAPFIKTTIESDKKNFKTEFYNQASEHTLFFELKDKARGKYQIERIRFFSTGSSNLFYVWRYFPVNQPLYLYPSRLHTTKNYLSYISNDKSHLEGANFKEFLRYQNGMSAKRIDWKKYAAKDELYWKKQDDESSEFYEINYNKLHGDKEERLSKMSYLCQTYANKNKKFALKTPTQSILVNKGINHYRKCLEVISEY